MFKEGMVDIKLIRESPEIVKENLKKRFKDDKIFLVDKIVALDGDWRKEKREVDGLRHERNKISEDINKLIKSGEKKKALVKIKKAKEIPIKIEKINVRVEKLEVQIKEILYKLPNMLHEDVLVGKDSSFNKELRKWGKIPKFNFKIKSHADIVEDLGVVNSEKGAEVAGSRFYYLKNELVILNLALQRFALDFLIKKGFMAIQPPYMINKFAISGAINFDDFKESVYKIEDENLYLIGTSEHAIAAMHENEIVDVKSPLKYAGLSSCFRKESGSHGRDTKGIFRVHRFEKVEQFVFCKPEDEDDIFNELIKNQEEIFQELEIPYRVVALCSSDIGGSMTKTYDLEGWYPSQNTYCELGSTSAARRYQSRKLNIKFQESGKTNFVFTLNGTAMTTQRTMTCLIENNQQEDGSIKIPKVLWKYCGFKKINVCRKK